MNRETILLTNHYLKEVKLKNTFSNIAAIIKFSDDDIRVIEDKFLKIPKKYLSSKTEGAVMDGLIRLSNDPSAVQDCEINATFQILANLALKEAAIKRMQYVNANILFTISFEDDLEEKVRYCISDIKCFRDLLSMQIFVYNEVNECQLGAFRAKFFTNSSSAASTMEES